MNNKDLLYKYLSDNAFETPPTVRELCAALSIKSTSTVFNLLHSLEDEGLINIARGKRRNISLVGRSQIQKVPLVGTVAAGLPILAQQYIEDYIAFEGSFDGELFALRIEGDSMIGAGILEGDLVVVRRTPVAEDGDIVVAMIEDEATVKRLYSRGKVIELHAENPDYPPIVADEIVLLGKVISVIRNYE